MAGSHSGFHRPEQSFDRTVFSIIWSHNMLWYEACWGKRVNGSQGACEIETHERVECSIYDNCIAVSIFMIVQSEMKTLIGIAWLTSRDIMYQLVRLLHMLSARNIYEVHPLTHPYRFHARLA